MTISKTEAFIMADIKEDIFMSTGFLNKYFIPISDFHYGNIIDFEWLEFVTICWSSKHVNLMRMQIYY